MIQKLFGSDSNSVDDSEDNSQMERLRGILYQNQEALEVLNDNSNTSYIEVTPDELDDLSELECFVDERQYAEAVRFAKRWSDDVEVFIRIQNDSILRVQVNQVVFTGDITNVVVRDFCRRFKTDVYATFDPMAEQHDEPYLSIEPW